MVAYLRHAVISHISSFAMRGLRLRRMDAGLLFVSVVVYAGVAAPPQGCGIVVRVLCRLCGGCGSAAGMWDDCLRTLSSMRGLRLRRTDAGLLFVSVVVYAGVAAPPQECGIVVCVRYLWVIFPNISHNNLVGRPITL